MTTRSALIVSWVVISAGAQGALAQPFLPGAQPTPLPPPRPAPPPVAVQPVPRPVHYSSNPVPVVLPPAAPGAVAPVSTNGPKIKFDEPNYDFGKIKAAEIVRHDFIFTNIGASTLHIADVRPSCGCTTAGTWDKTVEPGQTGKIPIQFNPANFSGAVGKSVTVTCDDPAQPTVVLQIHGTIWKPIDVAPAYAYFFVTEANVDTETRIIRIVNNMEENLEVSDLQCTNKAFKAELKTTKPGKEFEIHVGLVPPLGGTSVQAPVTLKTSSTNMPLISVNAFVMVQPTVQVMPQQLYLPSGPVTVNNSFAITIQNNGATNIALSDPAVNVEGATVNVQENQPGRRFTLQASFPAGFQIQAGRAVELTVKSTHPLYPVIKVPVLQFPAPATAPAPIYRPPVTMTSAPPRSPSIVPGSVRPGLRPVPVRPPPLPQ
jgi:hypothetical protein